MNTAAVYLVRFLSASAAAAGLFMIVHDDMGVSRYAIVVDALAVAGVLGIACAAGAWRGRK